MTYNSKITPTGCPGPIPGTQLWRCDGGNCVYRANVESCKQEILKRGYTIIFTNELPADVQEATKSVQQELAEAANSIVERDKRIAELEAQLNALKGDNK